MLYLSSLDKDKEIGLGTGVSKDGRDGQLLYTPIERERKREKFNLHLHTFIPTSEVIGQKKMLARSLLRFQFPKPRS